MESFAEHLQLLASLGPGGIDRFAASIPEQWVTEALEATGTASVRRRKLPAEQVFWLVVGMALFKDWSIHGVAEHLRLVLPGVSSLAPSALPQARGRLGPSPVKWLFRQVADRWSNVGGKAAYRGLALFGIDGTTMRVQDTDANFAHFTKPSGRNGEKNDSGYPLVRIACLMNLGTRLIANVDFGPYTKSEQELAQDLWATIPSNSLTMLDRGFINYKNFSEFVDQERGRHLLVRIRSNILPETIEKLSDGTSLVRMVPTRERKKEDPDIAAELVGRLIDYQHVGGEPSRLFTSLTDPVKYPATELIALYHERWELEIAFDELKTHMRDRAECLRSKTVAGVEQELWGLLLTYNLVRREMLLVAAANKLPPNRISFINALILIRNFWVCAAILPPGNIPKHLAAVRTDLKLLTLPPRRSERRYPRHVKIKLSGYKRNRGKRAPPRSEP